MPRIHCIFLWVKTVEELLRLEHVTRVFERGKRRVVAVNDVSLAIDRPNLVAILGPNGAGKSTLLNITAGILPPSSGKVFIKGIDVVKEPWRAKRYIGFVPQEEGIIPTFTVIENLLHIADAYGVPLAEAKKRVRELIEVMGLEEHQKKLASKLSGGLKKRLSIAMALISDPEILILDEPTTGLDPAARRAFVRMLTSLARDGKLVLMSTHIASDAELSNEVILMHRGRVVARAEPKKLIEEVVGLRTIVELVLDDQGDSEKLMELLAAKGWKAKLGKGSVRVTVSSFEHETPQLIETAHEAGFEVVELRVRKPSLDDVFVMLTGIELGEEL